MQAPGKAIRGRPVSRILLGESEKDVLQKLAAKRTAAGAEVKRAKSILLMNEGFSNTAISRRAGFCAATVGFLRSRFDQLRFNGLSDLPRSGPPRKIGDDRIEALIEKKTPLQTQRGNSLEHPQDGKEDGHLP